MLVTQERPARKSQGLARLRRIRERHFPVTVELIARRHGKMVPGCPCCEGAPAGFGGPEEAVLGSLPQPAQPTLLDSECTAVTPPLCELAHLIGTVLLEDHIDAGEKLTADGAHDYAVGLARPYLSLEVLSEVRIEPAGGDGAT